jgi:hypothetical protein
LESVIRWSPHCALTANMVKYTPYEQLGQEHFFVATLRFLKRGDVRW